MVKIKICGITNLEDAQAATELGADAIGFIFYKESPRYVSPDNVKEIAAALPPFLTKVGVFVNEQVERIREISEAASLNLIQLHGDESPEYCQQLAAPIMKVFRVQSGFNVRTMQDYAVAGFLLDTHQKDRYGGTGETFDWQIARHAKAYGPIVLSGGLNPGNVKEAVEFVRPYAVDVASGVEAYPGKKDADKLKAFFDEVQKATIK
ncbi:MAG: phosphoribosylanthranilate isomerase [bacterium]